LQQKPECRARRCRSTAPPARRVPSGGSRLRRRAAAAGGARNGGPSRSGSAAARLIEGARERKASGLDAFLQSYGLGTEEGIALMCLAEALLRVPDPETADALIHDKLAGIDWGEKLGDSDSTSSTRRPSR
jgi:RHH-type proline utilization regulon transcriptional repressor/proline dehydrogenase/delta 1-pyrroline-5-carboxylate dehydrogenase